MDQAGKLEFCILFDAFPIKAREQGSRCRSVKAFVVIKNSYFHSALPSALSVEPQKQLKINHDATCLPPGHLPCYPRCGTQSVTSPGEKLPVENTPARLIGRNTICKLNTVLTVFAA